MYKKFGVCIYLECMLCTANIIAETHLPDQKCFKLYKEDKNIASNRIILSRMLFLRLEVLLCLVFRSVSYLKKRKLTISRQCFNRKQERINK